jgi:6,7-dimethyl-8-ribityllumazine synthase
MATNLNNFSAYDPDLIPDASGMKFGIAVAIWNQDITISLRDATIKTLTDNGAREEDIKVAYVPGTFELTYAAKLLSKQNIYDAIICLGCVIEGETKHFDLICESVAQGLTQLNIESETPVIFGVLTTYNLDQAKDRSGGKLGNIGDEAAITAIEMAALRKELQ